MMRALQGLKVRVQSNQREIMMMVLVEWGYSSKRSTAVSGLQQHSEREDFFPLLPLLNVFSPAESPRMRLYTWA